MASLKPTLSLFGDFLKIPRFMPNERGWPGAPRPRLSLLPPEQVMVQRAEIIARGATGPFALPSYHQKGLDGGDADEQKGDAARTFAPHAAAVPPYSESAYDQNLHDLVALISQQRVILCSVTMTRDRIWRWYSCCAGASLPASTHDRDAGWLRPRAHAGPPASRRCRAACPRARGCAR
jgi:hypothetical protein